MKKIKKYILFGVIGLIILMSLVIWAGVSVFNYVTMQTIQMAQSPLAQQQIECLKTEVKKLPQLKPINCWSKLEALMQVQPWLERPVINNLMNLKVACLEPAPTPCEGADCVDTNTPKTSGDHSTTW